MHPADNNDKQQIKQPYISRSNVLIADDDPSTLLLLKHILLAEGHQVTEARTGRQAIELCKQHDFDLAILDVVMPDINGIEACRILHSQPGQSPTVLIITSLDDDLTIDQAFKSGATDYITKPINWSAFKHRVRRLVESSKSQHQIKQLEHYDPLTELPNRTLLLDLLESAIQRTHRTKNLLSFIMIDFDNFKLIKGAFDHQMSEKFIQSMARRLADTIRETDTLARTGDDEFCLIIENIKNIEDIILIADNISSSMNHDFSFASQTCRIKTSMGLTIYPQDGTGIDTIFRNAGLALSRAKQQTNNSYQFFSPDLSNLALRKIKLEKNFKNALQEKQFVLFYQPKIQLSNGRANAMEVLVRWLHPTQGLILPDEFIPLAEETGLISSLGDWVINTACEQLNQWINAGLYLKNMSINISPRQFREQDLITTFNNILARTGINPNLIELELTESILLHHDVHIESKLIKLHDMGIKISIDDYGTGYASLSHLKRLPIDTLKIDRSFTDGIFNDADDLAIVMAITGLAKALNLKLVAEGIETQEQLDKLRELKIDYGQGYYWSTPRTAEDFPEVMQGLTPGDSK